MHHYAAANLVAQRQVELRRDAARGARIRRPSSGGRGRWRSPVRPVGLVLIRIGLRLSGPLEGMNPGHSPRVGTTLSK